MQLPSLAKLLKFFLYVLALLALTEFLLRMQQKLGPLVELDFSHISALACSDTLHHRNPPGECNFRMDYWPSLKGIKKLYDKHGVRIESARPDYRAKDRPFVILFMGDSFMEGYDDEHTIPQQVWRYFQQTQLASYRIKLLNAACASYSPLIYTAQAKKLLPLIQPDMVVIDIDETDFLDDLVRYDKFAVRDRKGKIIAVRSDPVYREFLEGFVAIQKQPLYLIRLIMKFYHTRIRMNIIGLKNPHLAKESRFILDYTRGLGGRSEGLLSKHKDFFVGNLVEMLDTLIELTGDKRRVLVVYHSHFIRIKKPTEAESIVLSSISLACARTGAAYYDATADLIAAFAGRPENFYVESDVFGHFNFEGLDTYARLVGEKLKPMALRLLKTKYKTKPFKR